MQLIYYNHSPFWEDIFSNFSITVPEGYELREKDDHKQKRLEQRLQETKESLSYHEAKVQQLSKSISEQEGELKSLKSG